MTRFTSRSFRRRISRKAKKSRRRQTRKRSTPTVGGGDTFSREIPKNAVVTNPIQIT